MPKLYQHELIKSLRVLNEGIEFEQIDSVIDKAAAYINLIKKYFPETYIIIFSEIVKESVSFESFFCSLLNSPPVQERLTRIFLPAALYDICTDHKHEFLKKTHQKLIKIIRGAEGHPKIDPQTDKLYSTIIKYDEERIDIEFDSRKECSQHTISTGDRLIEFLKTYIELEKEVQEAVAGEVQKQSSWVDRVSVAASTSVIKKTVSFAA